jgi:tryptophanyl-tRNA synthetase
MLVTPDEQLEEVATGCRTAGIGCIDCKRIFVEYLMRVLDPIQAKYKELSNQRERVREVLNKNAAHCRKVAGETIIEVKKNMGLTPVWKI